MVISREPKTCFKLKSPDRARNLSLLSGNKGKRRIPTGMLLRFLFLYIYNSFFPLENNELVKLISNSEPPPCTNYLSSPKLSKFVQSSRPLTNFLIFDSSILHLDRKDRKDRNPFSRSRILASLFNRETVGTIRG